MAAIAEPSTDNPALVHQAKILALPVTTARRMADAIRALVADTTEQSQAGQPGCPTSLPIGMADVATALWTRFHKFDAADPRWFDRDRFVLSAGDGAMLLYALIHLTGYDGMSVTDLRGMGQLNPQTQGLPGLGEHPAIEATAGPHGQGFATAVGMAIAERNMAARFGKSLVDHRTWVIAGDGDMMQGISHEAASLAGQLCLSKLTVLYDENALSIDGEAGLSFSEDIVKRFAAYGWAAKRVDGHDPGQINAALSSAMRSKKPTLIACRTAAGFGAPTNTGTAEVSRDSLGSPEGPGARAMLGRHEQPFVTSDDLLDRWRAAGSRGAPARRSWLKRLARHNQRAEFERVVAGRLPDTWHEAVAGLKQQICDDRSALASRNSSLLCVEALMPATPEMIGGSVDLTRPRPTLVNGIAALSAGNYGGRYIHHGSRDHGMAAAANGMALHGGIIPVVNTALACSDCLRPALRMSAIMRRRVVYVVTQDPAGMGEGGPVQQPGEHLASLRTVANVHVMRPADAMETAECWELAIRRSEGPSVLVISRQASPVLRTDWGENCCARGGYVLAEAEGPRQATIIATGPEVAIAMTAREKLAADGVAVAVVSLPCWELFDRQDRHYRDQVLGRGDPHWCRGRHPVWLGAVAGRRRTVHRHVGDRRIGAPARS